MRSLAALFAHPDDETYAIGGTLSRYSTQGVRCSLYCATDGDAGRSSGVPVSSRAELGALRRAELRAACDVLGVSELVCGGHSDGALAAAEPDLVISQMIALLRRERPDVVITFGPEGAPTGHRDHKAISRLATSAFLLSGLATAFPEQLSAGLSTHRPARLCYVTWPPPAPGAELATEGQPIDVRVPVRDCLGRKIAAFEMHRTQHVHRPSFERLALTEAECYFVASGAPVPADADDLFAALR